MTLALKERGALNTTGMAKQGKVIPLLKIKYTAPYLTSAQEGRDVTYTPLLP
jgi:hypothetical protein